MDKRSRLFAIAVTAFRNDGWDRHQVTWALLRRAATEAEARGSAQMHVEAERPGYAIEQVVVAEATEEMIRAAYEALAAPETPALPIHQHRARDS